MNKKYFETKTGSLEEKITQIAKEQPTIKKQEPQIKLEVKNTYFDTKPGSLADAAAKVVSEGLDPVNKVAVKKKFDDRKDKDIDNDGDVDSSDKFLHKRRKAISKAMKEDLGKEDEPKVSKIIGKLKKASDAHAGQAKDLEKAMKEAVTPDDKGEKQNMSKVKAYTDPKKGEKEIINPISENENEKIASLRTRQMALQTKLRDLDPGNPKDKTKMAITKNDIENIQMKMDDLKKSASKQEKKTYSELRKETREIQLGDKGKTLTGKSAPKIDVEPRANPI